MRAVSQTFMPSVPASSMAGESSDQKEAAVITPAAKPSMESSTVLLTSRKKNTSAAPSAVTDQVNMVASSACQTWPSCENQLSIS